MSQLIVICNVKQITWHLCVQIERKRANVDLDICKYINIVYNVYIMACIISISRKFTVNLIFIARIAANDDRLYSINC